MASYVWTILFAYDLFGLLSVLYGTVSRHHIPSQHNNPTNPYITYIIDRFFPLFFFFLLSIVHEEKKSYTICCSSLLFSCTITSPTTSTGFYSDVDRPPVVSSNKERTPGIWDLRKYTRSIFNWGNNTVSLLLLV